MFAERGYYATAMEEVAQRAGISKPMIYSYFGSKEGLYLAFINRIGTVLLERMRGAAPPEAGAVERLEAGITEFFRFVDEHRDGWRVLHAEAATGGGPLAEELSDLRRRIAEAIGRLLAASAAKADGARPSGGQLEAEAHAFVGAGESLANWWLSHPEVETATVASWLMRFARSGLDLEDCPPPRAGVASRAHG
jgi:AcrR family transcriptional regulator